MSQQIIDTSTETDTLAAGLAKANSNFTELYAALISTGMIIDYMGSISPSGWLILNGGTIGNAGSGASERQNADTQNLFVLLWNSIVNAYAPVSGGRGASALADFNAGKTITIPDFRGRVSVGQDSGLFTHLGQTNGSETVTLAETNLPSHTHNVEVPSSINSVQSGGDFSVLTNSSTSSVTSSSSGSGTPVSIIQPSLAVKKIIKL